MTPVIISTVLFIILEGLHHFSPMLSFGVAIGGLLTSLALIIAERPAKPHPAGRAALPPSEDPTHG